uniref:Uncharacterized protein n=1 Tax=Arundo donax TaxID=35708 RepID=A0A0A9G974_ARUDO
MGEGEAKTKRTVSPTGPVGDHHRLHLRLPLPHPWAWDRSLSICAPGESNRALRRIRIGVPSRRRCRPNRSGSRGIRLGPRGQGA